MYFIFFFLLFFFNFKFYFIFKLYITVLVLPNIKMNPPQVYMCSPLERLLCILKRDCFRELKVSSSLNLPEHGMIGTVNG